MDLERIVTYTENGLGNVLLRGGVCVTRTQGVGNRQGWESKVGDRVLGT